MCEMCWKRNHTWIKIWSPPSWLLITQSKRDTSKGNWQRSIGGESKGEGNRELPDEQPALHQQPSN